MPNTGFIPVSKGRKLPSNQQWAVTATAPYLLQPEPVSCWKPAPHLSSENTGKGGQHLRLPRARVAGQVLRAQLPANTLTPTCLFKSTFFKSVLVYVAEVSHDHRQTSIMTPDPTPTKYGTILKYITAIVLMLARCCGESRSF